MTFSPSRLGLEPGSSGSPISVITNSFAVSTIPQQNDYIHNLFYHWPNTVEFPSLSRFPNRDRSLEIIDKLQIQEAALFNPRAAYDGRRNLFRSVPLDLPNNGATFKVFMGDIPQEARNNARPIEVRITKVAEIDPRSIKAVIDGKCPHGSQSLTTLTLFNVLIRMKPIMSHPSNARCFFTKDVREHLGKGLELWRGLFQSVRPTIGRLLVNIDTATAVMYSSGPLIEVILAFLGCRDVRELTPSRLNKNMERKLNQFLRNLLVESSVPPRPGRNPKYRKFQNIVMTGADQYKFTNDKTGEVLSITEHFKKYHNYKVQLGNIICAGFSKNLVYPIEVLKVKEGQMYKKVLPPALAPRALRFSTQKPHERIKVLEDSSDVLGYTQSDYLRHSGITIDPRLISIKGRVLAPPPIQWGGIQQPEIPRDGAWNVLRKKFYKPANVKAWSVVVYDSHIDRSTVMSFVKMFVTACLELGMHFPTSPPPIIDGRPQGGEEAHYQDMDRAGTAAIKHFAQGQDPRLSFILVILPDSAIDIRTSVKSWGDCHRGVPTQCMKREKLFKANNQYCNNLALKVNTKLGGVNSVPSSAGNARNNMNETLNWLSSEPTMVIGADVSHPAPGSGRPSVTGLVSSVDEHFCQYVASCQVQGSRVEIIEDLPMMIENAVKSFCSFWREIRSRSGVFPRRIIFYRDGVSEGQFDEIGHKEINVIKAQLSEIWRRDNHPGEPPKLTFIVVAKKHHVRFFPQNKSDADRSGNCPAGLVIDQEIVSPVDYDYYLQSHGGLLGTSRPSHYSVIHDGNGLNADRLQGISYALCHVYARATRSVSIPAPVYYADIVCARGRFHSRLIRDGGDDSTMASSEISLSEHKRQFKQLAGGMKTSMYFM